MELWNIHLFHQVMKSAVLGNCLCVRGCKAETLFSVCSVLSLLLLHSDCKKAERKHGDKVLAGVPVQQGTREAEEREDLTIQLHLSPEAKAKVICSAVLSGSLHVGTVLLFHFFFFSKVCTRWQVASPGVPYQFKSQISNFTIINDIFIENRW